MTYDANFIAALEPAQLASAREVPLPRQHLGRGVMLLLVLLRVYVIAAIPVVVYAFITALLHPS